MRKEPPSLLVDEVIMNKIYFIRGQKVMLDSDLSELYGVETKQLKRQVNRNIDRFPEDFMFELTKEEHDFLRSQIGTLKRGAHSKFLPFVFTEHGVLMLSSVLSTTQAIQVNIHIMRVFSRIRKMLTDNSQFRAVIEKFEKQIGNNTKNIELLFHYMDELTEQKKVPRKQIGYKAVKN